jgi:hypothetical protein
MPCGQLLQIGKGYSARPQGNARQHLRRIFDTRQTFSWFGHPTVASTKIGPGPSKIVKKVEFRLGRLSAVSLNHALSAQSANRPIGQSQTSLASSFLSIHLREGGRKRHRETSPSNMLRLVPVPASFHRRSVGRFRPSASHGNCAPVGRCLRECFFPRRSPLDLSGSGWTVSAPRGSPSGSGPTVS